MASVVDELNGVLVRERGEAEALRALLHELAKDDPDVAYSGADVLRTLGWTCEGLYRRISLLHGTPVLDSADIEDKLSEKPDLKSKLTFLCSEQDKDRKEIKRLLARDDLDSDTRGFLTDLLQTHLENIRWCKSALSEWKPDV